MEGLGRGDDDDNDDDDVMLNNILLCGRMAVVAEGTTAT